MCSEGRRVGMRCGAGTEGAVTEEEVRDSFWRKGEERELERPDRPQTQVGIRDISGTETAVTETAGTEAAGTEAAGTGLAETAPRARDS